MRNAHNHHSRFEAPDFKREIYLIFQDSAEFTGSAWFTPGFKHVFAIEKQPLGWTCIDPNRFDLMIDILPVRWEADLMNQYLINKPGDTILKIMLTPHNEPTILRPSILSCVSLVKYMLGVSWPFVWTPWQLYIKLISDTHQGMEITQLWIQDVKHAEKQEPQQSEQKFKHKN